MYTNVSLNKFQGLSWSWSYGSWIYNYLYNQCLSPLTLWVRITLRQGVPNTTLCDKVCQWLAAGRWFSLGTPVSSTNKTEILLKVVLNTITLIVTPCSPHWPSPEYSCGKRNLLYPIQDASFVSIVLYLIQITFIKEQFHFFYLMNCANNLIMYIKVNCS
jgi:hypothetical protein